MLRLNRLIKHTNKWTRTSTFLSSQQQTQAVFDSSVSCQHFFRTQIRFLDIYKIGNKAAIEKERARLADELNRGYFADISEFKKHGGKEMINSWSMPFLEAFRDAKNVHLYEVSFIDSWFLCLNPIKKMLLRMMRKSDTDGNDALQKQIVYSFGDHYYMRKDLRILNLLTGYIFLLDKFGRIRWGGFGLATEEELSSLVSCTSLLLEEK